MVMKNLILLIFLLRKAVDAVDALDDARYTVLIDAGSAGTRMFVYSYDEKSPLESLKEVVSQKHKTGLSCAFKLPSIALSSLVGQRHLVEGLLQELLRTARDYVPSSLISTTKVSLKATAGLRQLSQESQDWLIELSRAYLASSGFWSIPTETRVIDGKEEAFFGWMTVAIAFKIHQSLFAQPQNKYFGALDMGGASKQIAFILRDDVKSNHHSCRGDWVLQNQGNQEETLVVSRSIHGLGLRSAMDEIVSIRDRRGLLPANDEIVLNIVRDVNNRNAEIIEMSSHPCLATGEFLPGSIHDYKYTLYGEGNFTKCLNLIRATFLPRIAAEIEIECIHKNRPDVFIAMDSFPKMINMLGLLDDPHGISPNHILENGFRICQLSWERLLLEVEPSLPAYHAQRACFASAYIYFLLTDVYGLHDHEVGGFIPLFEYNDHDLSWVLGAVGVSILPLDSVSSLN